MSLPVFPDRPDAVRDPFPVRPSAWKRIARASHTGVLFNVVLSSELLLFGREWDVHQELVPDTLEKFPPFLSFLLVSIVAPVSMIDPVMVSAVSSFYCFHKFMV